MGNTEKICLMQSASATLLPVFRARESAWMHSLQSGEKKMYHRLTVGSLLYQVILTCYVHRVLKPNVRCRRQIYFLKSKSYFVEALLPVKMVVPEIPSATVCGTTHVKGLHL